MAQHKSVTDIINLWTDRPVILELL